MFRAEAEGLGFTRFFLVARPVRTAAVLMAAVLFVLSLGVATVRSLSLDGEQFAESNLGSADGMVTQAGLIALGTSDVKVDQRLAAGVAHAGGGDAQVGYVAPQQIPVGAPRLRVTMTEASWTGRSAPEIVRLRAGRWGRRGEAVVSPSMATRWPIGSTIAFYSGALTLHVVGIAEDRFARDADEVLLPRGTFSAVRMSASASALLDNGPQRFVSWRGLADQDAINRAVSVAVAATSRQTGGVNVYPQTLLKSTLEQYAPSLTFQLVLGALVAPMVAALIGAIIAARFITRVRQTLWTIGITWSATRRASIAAISFAITAGGVTGAVLGLAAGWGIRPLLDAAWTRDLGPIDGLAWIGAAAAGSAGVGLALGLLMLRQRAHVTAERSRHRQRVLILAMPTIALVSVVLGFLTVALDPNDTVLLSAAGFFFGLAVLMALPAVFIVLARIRPRSMPLLLAIRRITGERYSSGWILVGVSALLLLGFSGSTLVNSGLAAAAAQTASGVPDGQIQFTPNVDGTAAQQAKEKFETATHLSHPVAVRVLDQGTDDAVGSTVVVPDIAALRQVLHHAVPANVATVLEHGGVAGLHPGTAATFDLSSGRTLTLREAYLSGIDPAWVRSRQGFVLPATVRAHQKVLTDVSTPTWVYTSVSSAQQNTARDAAATVDLDPSWVQVYRAPDTVAASTKTVLSGTAIALIAGLLMVFVSSAEARGMRPTLAGMRAVGIRSSWIARTVLYRSLLLVAIALLTASVATIFGGSTLIAAARLPFPLLPPIPAMGATALVMLAATALSGLSAARRLRMAERAL